jgi:hypothetical protein
MSPLPMWINGGSGDRIIHLRVSFDETQVMDNTKLVFQVSSVTAGAAVLHLQQQMVELHNLIIVMATTETELKYGNKILAFVQQPSTVFYQYNMSPAPTVELTDLYGQKRFRFYNKHFNDI